MHPRNRHRTRYDFEKLTAASKELAPFVSYTPYREQSIDFSDPKAVKALNRSLLMLDYGVDFWDIPEGYLCPPVPGRADYIHNMADLLAQSNGGTYPEGEKIVCMDIGVGANCIYPIVGVKEYGMHFIGTDTDRPALDNARALIMRNQILQGKVELRPQPDPRAIFKGVLKEAERIDLVFCNPPFHDSAETAVMSNQRKRNKLMRGKKEKPLLNFGGQNRELWCEGGEYRFVSNMIAESKGLGKQVLWFSSLVSKSAHLKGFEKQLLQAGIKDMKVIPMGQGSKISRVLAWSFLDEKERSKWFKPVAKEAAKPEAKATTKPAAKKAVKPAGETTPQKVTKPAGTAVVKKVTKPKAEPTVAKAVKPASKVVTKKVTKPASEKAPIKTTKPASEKGAKKAVKDATEPVAKKETKTAGKPADKKPAPKPGKK